METTRIDDAPADRTLDSVCKTCQNTWGWHMNTITQHPFNDGTLSTSQTFGKRLADGTRTKPGGTEPATVDVVTDRWPFDPVLRQALIDKGVITPDDLLKAEQQIRAVTDAFNGAGGVPTS